MARKSVSESTRRPAPRDVRTTHGPRERPLKRKVLAFDLVDEAKALHREQGWIDRGHSAKTLVKQHEQRIVLIAMKRGTRMMKHQTAGAVSIQVLTGHLRIHVGMQTIEIASGHLLALDHALPHDVEALEHTDFVLSLSAKPRRSS